MEALDFANEIQDRFFSQPNYIPEVIYVLKLITSFSFPHSYCTPLLTLAKWSKVQFSVSQPGVSRDVGIHEGSSGGLWAIFNISQSLTEIVYYPR